MPYKHTLVLVLILIVPCVKWAQVTSTPLPLQGTALWKLDLGVLVEKEQRFLG